LAKSESHIIVFEHEILRFDRGEKRMTEDQFKALQLYYGSGVPYYSLCYNGVQFCEYVGVLKVGKTVIEVLPKADKNLKSTVEENKWRDILIGMLRAVGTFNIQSTSQGNLKVKANTILDLYFELFVKEVEYLLHSGLIKKYRKIESNVTSLKGNLQFGKHIQQNLTHQERFYIRHNTYDLEHQLHRILYKTINLLKQINTNTNLHSRIGALLLNFPEMPDLKVTAATFEKISYSRKNQQYQSAIEIAKLLLLQFHPDISKGGNNVLALMFDMNKLWEQFVYASLRKGLTHGSTITAQTSKLFWKPENGYNSKMRPDIVINMNTDNCIVLDTKWKNLNGNNPSPEDLRQMYVYHEYFGANKVALVYPSTETTSNGGSFYNPISETESKKACLVIGIAVEADIKRWQERIDEVVRVENNTSANNLLTLEK